MGFGTYLAIGIFGAFAINGKTCTNTLVDCYLTEWSVLIVEFTYLLGRLSSFPIMVQIGRTRLIELFVEKVENKHANIYNISFMLFASVISIISPIIPLSTLMSLVGAIFCYYFIYFLPTQMHFGCLYGKKQAKDSLLS